MLGSNVQGQRAPLSSFIATLVPGTLVRLRGQVHSFVNSQLRIGVECLGTTRERARVLPRYMCDLLVTERHDSSVRGEVTVGTGTLETTEFVILPDMSDQTILVLHRLGTPATTPSGQVAMLFTIMGTEFRTKKKQSLIKRGISSINA